MDYVILSVIERQHVLKSDILIIGRRLGKQWPPETQEFARLNDRLQTMLVHGIISHDLTESGTNVLFRMRTQKDRSVIDAQLEPLLDDHFSLKPCPPHLPYADDYDRIERKYFWRVGRLKDQYENALAELSSEKKIWCFAICPPDMRRSLVPKLVIGLPDPERATEHPIFHDDPDVHFDPFSGVECQRRLVSPSTQ